MLKISIATSQHIPAIIRIAETTWWPTYREILTDEQIRYMLDKIYAPQVLEKQMQDGTQLFIIGEDEHEPKGFASFGPRHEDPDTYKLHKLYVLSDTQRRGYGRMLIDEVKKRMLSLDKHRLELNVNRFNKALQFYQKYGFEIIREEDIPIGPYWMNDYVMRLEF